MTRNIKTATEKLNDLIEAQEFIAEKFLELPDAMINMKNFRESYSNAIKTLAVSKEHINFTMETLRVLEHEVWHARFNRTNEEGIEALKTVHQILLTALDRIFEYDSKVTRN